MKLSPVLKESADLVWRCENLMRKLLVLSIAAFLGVFMCFFALFGVAQRHNQNVKSLMDCILNTCKCTEGAVLQNK